VDVAPGRKRPVPGTRDDDAPDRVVGTHLGDRVVQFGGQLTIHSVEFVRTIQGENRHALFLFDQDILVSHLVLPQRMCWMIARSSVLFF
jgi:hypothetical protein